MHAIATARSFYIPENLRPVKCERSHRPTRQRTRHMQGCTAPGHAPRFLAASGPLTQHCRPRRHRLSAFAYRPEMSSRCARWAAITRTERAASRDREDRGETPRSPEESLSLNNVTQPSCTWPPLATTRSVWGTAPRGSLGLIGEPLPAKGGFHHHPTDGVHHH